MLVHQRVYARTIDTLTRALEFGEFVAKRQNCLSSPWCRGVCLATSRDLRKLSRDARENELRVHQALKMVASTLKKRLVVRGAITILKNDGVRQWVADDIPYIMEKMIETTNRLVVGITIKKHLPVLWLNNVETARLHPAGGRGLFVKGWSVIGWNARRSGQIGQGFEIEMAIF